jgi:hypothetical protein
VSQETHLCAICGTRGPCLRHTLGCGPRWVHAEPKECNATFQRRVRGEGELLPPGTWPWKEAGDVPI